MQEIIKFWETKWDKNLETGNEEIDSFHKHLSVVTNNLYSLCSDVNTKADDLKKAIEEAERLMFKHFEQEEDLFAKSQLNCIHEEYKDHEKFRNTIRYIQSLNSSLLLKAVLLNQLIVRYLEVHLIEVDMACVKQLNDKMNN